MKPWYYDLKLLLRSKVAVGSLVLLLVLTTASLLSGVQRIDSQREAIARIGALHAAAITAFYAVPHPRGKSGQGTTRSTGAATP